MRREGGGGRAASAAFRLFCKDPGRVVENQTIRKLRTTNHKTKDPKQIAKLLDATTTTTLCLEDKDKAKAAVGEIEETHKLNSSRRRSWSCGGGRSSHDIDNVHPDVVVANDDFLRGALELEHSLAMLRNLQHDSNDLTEQQPKKNYPKDGGDMGCSQDNNNNNNHDPFAEIRRVMRDGVGPSSNLFDLTQKVDSSDVPSTSSSYQTSFVNSSGFVSPDSSSISTSTPSPNKKKSNLVAKLVSLDDTFRKRSLKQQRKPPLPMLEVVGDSLKPRTNDHYDTRVVMDDNRKTLDEMIESVRLKGLLKNNSNRSCGDDDHTPPIVLIKPTRYSCLSLDLPITPIPRHKAIPTYEEITAAAMLGSTPVSDKSFKDRAWEGEVYYDRRAKDKSAYPAHTILPKDHKQETRYNNMYSDVVSYRSNQGRKNRSLKNGHHVYKEAGCPLEEREDESRELSSIADNESILQLDDTVLAGQLDSEGNIIEGEYHSPIQITAVPIQPANAGIEDHPQAIVSQNHEEFDCSLSESSSLTSYEEDEFLDQEINKLISPITQLRLVVANHEGEGTDHHSDDDTHCHTLPPLNTSKEEYKEAIGHDNDKESLPVTTTADDTHLDDAVGGEEGFGEIARWKAMLLSSSSFLRRANELFGLLVDPERHIANEISYCTLVLECANELIELYGLLSQERLMRSPQVLGHVIEHERSCFTSINQVVDQVCKEIDSLRSQRKKDYDCPVAAVAADNLPLVVERDVMGNNGVISGVWGVGWNNSMGVFEDVEETGRIVDWLILDELIEEIVEEVSSVSVSVSSSFSDWNGVELASNYVQGN